MTVVFFGTHSFAIDILQGLIDDSDFQVIEVITQPDKPVGRKHDLQSPPIKIFAEKHGIPVSQPASLKQYELPHIPDINIVAQYGKIIPPHILSAPRFGTINVHTSLLPKYRGASPIQSALLNGDLETGVTIMQMDEGLDTGPILLQKRLSIQPDETYGELEKRLALLGKTALLEALLQFISGSLRSQPQDDTQASSCTQLSRDDGRIDWQQPCASIYNQFRACTPWPGVWTLWEDARIKILGMKPSDKRLTPGKVELDGSRILVGCADTAVEITQLQREGKKPANASEFIRGYANIADATLV